MTPLGVLAVVWGLLLVWAALRGVRLVCYVTGVLRGQDVSGCQGA